MSDCEKKNLPEVDGDYYCLGNGDVVEKEMWIEQVRKAGFYPVSMSTSLDDGDGEAVTMVGNTKHWDEAPLDTEALSAYRWKKTGFLDAKGVEELYMASLMLLTPLIEKDMTVGQRIVNRLGRWLKCLKRKKDAR